MKEGYRKRGSTSAGKEKRIRVSDDLLWGLNPVLEALSEESSRVSELTIVQGKRGSKKEEIIALARTGKVKIHFVDSLKLTGPEASQIRHQGVVARVTHIPLTSFDQMVQDFAAAIEQGRRPRLIACDSLQDPHNLGAVIRSASASGMDGVIITRERSAPLGGTAAKSAAGALSLIPIAQVTNLAGSLKKLKKAGAWVYGAIKDREAQSIYNQDWSTPLCLVVGNEGQGIRPLIQKECDMTVSIPMAGTIESLNSSVAAAVIMFEIQRQTIMKED